MRLSVTDPHPPPYLRVLLAFDWCRRAVGTRPLGRVGAGMGSALSAQGIARGRGRCCRTRAGLCPSSATRARNHALPRAREPGPGRPVRPGGHFAVRGSQGGHARGRRHAGSARPTPCAQLAVFADMREMRAMTEEKLDDLMTAWLRRLGQRRPRRKTSRQTAGR